jgi:FKBP-type peptidyl-prolyl cis-trans isomerase 2
LLVGAWSGTLRRQIGVHVILHPRRGIVRRVPHRVHVADAFYFSTKGRSISRVRVVIHDKNLLDFNHQKW